MSVNWSTLVADADGTVNYGRLRGLVSVLLALLGGAVTIAVTLVTLLSAKAVDTTIFSIMVAALVLPITGGKIADVFTAKKNGAAPSA